MAPSPAPRGSACYRCCRRRLLAPTIPGAPGAVDVVVARDPRFHAEILAEMPAHPLAEQFLPAVAVLRHRRVGVGFFQWSDIGLVLAVVRVDAGRRGEE